MLLFLSDSRSPHGHQDVAHPIHIALEELEQPFEIDHGSRPLSLQEAQDGSNVTSLFGCVLGQLGDLAFDGGAPLVGVFELVGLLALTGGLEQGFMIMQRNGSPVRLTVDTPREQRTGRTRGAVEGETLDWSPLAVLDPLRGCLKSSLAPCGRWAQGPKLRAFQTGS